MRETHVDLLARAFEAYPLGGECSEYLEMIDDVAVAVHGAEGTKLDIVMGYDAVKNDRRLRLALILGDIISLYPDPRSFLLSPAESFPLNPELLAAVPGLDSIAQRGLVGVGYGFCAYAEGDVLALADWARAGRVLFRPLPTLRLSGPNGEAKDLRTEPLLPAHVLPAAGHASGASAQIPIRGAGRTAIRDAQLGALTIPYLDSVPIGTLLKIIDDESDVLHEMRSSLRNLLKSAPSDVVAANTIIADEVQPAVSRVERRLRSIGQVRSLRIAGAGLGTAALGLVALTGSSLATAVSSILGGAGLSVLANEIADLKKERSEVREMPYYFLWRVLSRTRKRE